MSVTYEYKSLAEIADYFANKAKAKRNAVAPGSVRGQTKGDLRDLKVEAATWEAAAHIMRNARIVKGTAP
jgi:hypothetical protein